MLRFLFLVFALCAAVPAAAGPRLDAIRSRDALICALSATEAGMGKREAGGNFSGFEADFCRAVSVTIFGTPKVRFLAIDTLDAFLNGEADIAIRRLTWTFAREAGRLRFGPVVLHDGQTFLVKEAGGASKIGDLSGKRICTSLDAAFTANLKRAFGERKFSLNMLNSATRADAEKAFFAGDCDALSADATELASALNARPDIAIRRLTWTFAREAGRLRFGPVVLYDGQTFLVKAAGGASKIGDLSGKRICTSLDAAFTANLKRAFGERKFSLNMLNSATRTDAEKAFFAGDCEALSADATELASALNARPDIASRYRILPERISKEPLSPVMRRGDEELFDAVRWTFFALVAAEDLRLTRRAALGKPEGPLRDFLEAPAPPGFAPQWTERLVRNFGNYGAIYDRHLGRDSPARLARGQNALIRDGGLLFAPPFK